MLAVVLAPISLLNIGHGVAEYRRPDYRRQFAEEHLRTLRVAIQDLDAKDDEDS